MNRRSPGWAINLLWYLWWLSLLLLCANCMPSDNRYWRLWSMQSEDVLNGAGLREQRDAFQAAARAVVAELADAHDLGSSSRFTIRSWSLRRSDSATRQRTPPGPSNRARVAMKWKKRTAKLRIEEWQQDGEASGIFGEITIRQPQAAHTSCLFQRQLCLSAASGKV
jgi:hypothetical protein